MILRNLKVLLFRNKKGLNETPSPKGQGFSWACPATPDCLRFAPGGHSSPGLKAWAFLTGSYE